MRILVTGATGLVGRAVVARMAADGHEVIAASRSPLRAAPGCVRWLEMTSLGTDDTPLRGNCATDVVVHTAARVHVMRDEDPDSRARFREVNVAGSLAVARQARAAGAHRIVFLSSIKVLGEHSPIGAPLKADTPTAASDPYAQSKLEAERALEAYCTDAGMELVVIRPPLVYGPGVKANFERLMRAVARGRPLPFGSLDGNRRSLVALDNLVDLIAVCCTHPAATGQPLLVSDGEDLSTADLVRRLARALGVAPRLVPVPAWMLAIAGVVTGRREAVERLCGSLQVDIGATRERLQWWPPIDPDEGLARAARAFLAGTEP